MFFSIIIPVFNRPHEIKELLYSLSLQDYISTFEIIIIEDGSTFLCKNVVEEFKKKLTISYIFKKNSGPGDSRNFGMNLAKGDYFIIFDSDCIIPKNYLSEIHKSLKISFTDCYGGPDAAHKSFSKIQRAIDFSMTSFLTTGGIRGKSEKLNTFQPRSFNMGISKKAFLATNGFSNIHPGEDPDLTIRLWKLGFKTKLIKSTFVYHKRRINFKKFYNQVTKFGKARVILNNWHPKFIKFTYFLPALFVISFVLSIFITFIISNILLLKLYSIYFIFIFITSTFQNRDIFIGFLSTIAACIQIFGYGLGYIIAFYKINILKNEPEKAFPEMFFNHSKIVSK